MVWLRVSVVQCACAGEWEHWSKRVVEYVYPSDSVPEYSSILVPNVDNVRTKFLIDVIAKQHKVIESIVPEHNIILQATALHCLRVFNFYMKVN